MIRFEILLPLFYNDGQAIEREKFVEADDDLVQQFGSTSTDTVVVRGQWPRGKRHRMDFQFSNKVRTLQQRLTKFMDDDVAIVFRSLEIGICL